MFVIVIILVKIVIISDCMMFFHGDGIWNSHQLHNLIPDITLVPRNVQTILSRACEPTYKISAP